jgi:hypothetical protein
MEELEERFKGLGILDPTGPLKMPRGSVRVTSPKEIAPGMQVFTDRSRRQWFTGKNNPAVPLLILSLYSRQFFDVPLAFIAEPGWRIWWIKRGNPNQGKYAVSEEKWEKFQQFSHLAEKGMAELKQSNYRDAGFEKKFQLAAERYFRATFISSNLWLDTLGANNAWLTDIDSIGTDHFTPLPDDVGVTEEALLQYVFALEALLSNKKDQRKKTTENFRSRLATIVGRDRRERKHLNKIADHVYCARSRIVHGDEIETYPDFGVTRRLCECALGILFLLASEAPSVGVGEIVYNLSTTDELKRKEALALVDSTRRRFYELVAEPERFDDPKVIDINSAQRS